MFAKQVDKLPNEIMEMSQEDFEEYSAWYHGFVQGQSDRRGS